MSDWKYVMFEANGQMVPVIFPNTLIHQDMADGAGHAIRHHVIRAKPGNWSSKLVSAGFVANLAVLSAYGKSESLDNLKSGKDDTQIINEMPYCHGLLDGMPVEAMYLMGVIESLMSRVREITNA